MFPNFQEKHHCIHELSRTDLHDDVVDVTSFSALDVVERKPLHPRRRHLHVAMLFFGKFGQPCLLPRPRHSSVPTS